MASSPVSLGLNDVEVEGQQSVPVVDSSRPKPPSYGLRDVEIEGAPVAPPAPSIGSPTPVGGGFLDTAKNMLAGPGTVLGNVLPRTPLPPAPAPPNPAGIPMSATVTPPAATPMPLWKEGLARAGMNALLPGAGSALPTQALDKPLVDVNAAKLENRIPGTGVASQGGRGVVSGLESIATGLTTPESIGVAGAMGVPVLGRLLGLGFSVKMIEDLRDQYPEFKKAYDSGDTESAAKIGTQMVANAAMGGFGLAHGATDLLKTEPTANYESRQSAKPPSERDIGAGGTPGPQNPEVMPGPQEPPPPVKPTATDHPGPRTPVMPTAAQPTTPEAPETLDTQLGQMAQGLRKVVMVPKSNVDQGFMPGSPLPQGVSITADAFGNRYYFDKQQGMTAEKVRSAAKNNTLPEILGGPVGMQAPDKSVIPPDRAVVVSAKGPDGKEAQSTATLSEMAPETLAATQPLVPPGGTLEVRSPQAAIAERVGEPALEAEIRRPPEPGPIGMTPPPKTGPAREESDHEMLVRGAVPQQPVPPPDVRVGNQQRARDLMRPNALERQQEVQPQSNADWAKPGQELFRGAWNVPLNDAGVQDALDVARRTAGQFTEIHASPLGRAQQTAAEIAKTNPQAGPVRTNPVLAPWTLGGHEGAPVSPGRIEDLNAHIRNPDQPLAGVGRLSGKPGESFNQFKDPLISHVIDQVSNYQPGQKILNVTHYRDIRAVDAWLKAGGSPERTVDTGTMTSKGKEKPGQMFRLDPETGALTSAKDASQPGIYFLRHGETSANEGAKAPSQLGKNPNQLGKPQNNRNAQPVSLPISAVEVEHSESYYHSARSLDDAVGALQSGQIRPGAGNFVSVSEKPMERFVGPNPVTFVLDPTKMPAAQPFDFFAGNPKVVNGEVVPGTGEGRGKDFRYEYERRTQQPVPISAVRQIYIAPGAPASIEGEIRDLAAKRGIPVVSKIETSPDVPEPKRPSIGSPAAVGAKTPVPPPVPAEYRAKPSATPPPIPSAASQFLKSEEGSFNPQFVKDLLKEPQELWQKRQMMTRALAANAPTPQARQAGQHSIEFLVGNHDWWVTRVNQEIDAIKKTLTPVEQNALTVMREYKSRPGQLVQYLTNSHPNLKGAGRPEMEDLKPAIRLAMNPTPAMLAADKRYSDLAELHLLVGQKGDWLKSSIPPTEYVPHMLIPKDKVGSVETGGGGGGNKMPRNFSHAKQRQAYDTFLDAVADGAKPRTINPFDAMTIYADEFGWKRATAMWEDAIKAAGQGKWGFKAGQWTKDKNGNWVPPTIPEGWVPFARPSQRFANEIPVIDPATGKPEILHQKFFVPKEIDEAMRPVTAGLDPLLQIPWVKKVQQYQQWLKGIDLAFSMFHPKALEMMTLSDMALNPKNAVAWAKMNMDDPFFKGTEADGAMHGLRTDIQSRTVDAYRNLEPGQIPSITDVLTKLPVIKQVDKKARELTHLTFGVMQRKMKVWDYGTKTAAWIGEHPNATAEELSKAKTSIARLVNAKYGGLNWEMMGLTKTQLALARMAILAPDWFMSNVESAKIPFEGGFGATLKGAAKQVPIAGRAAPADWESSAGSQAGRRFWIQGFLVAGALTQLLSYYFTGKPSKRFTQVHEGTGPDGKEIYRNWFMTGAPGELVNVLNGIGDRGVGEGLAKWASSKLNAYLRTGLQLSTGETYTGKKINDPKASNLVKSLRSAGYGIRGVSPVPFGVQNAADSGFDPAESMRIILSGRTPSHITPEGMRSTAKGMVPVKPKQELPFWQQVTTGRVNAPDAKSIPHMTLKNALESYDAASPEQQKGIYNAVRGKVYRSQARGEPWDSGTSKLAQKYFGATPKMASPAPVGGTR